MDLQIDVLVLNLLVVLMSLEVEAIFQAVYLGLKLIYPSLSMHVILELGPLLLLLFFF
jgi:hypothetical protein